MISTYYLFERQEVEIQESQNNNDHWYHNNIKLGSKVSIVKKEHQRTGELTTGNVKRLLTKKPKHTLGIKVRLETGEVGRVQKILS